MEKHQYYRFSLIFSIVIFLGLISFVSCLAAEFKRAKKSDIKLDRKLCYVPGSHAFGFGIAALVCLFMSQIIGSSIIIYCKVCKIYERNYSLKARKPAIATSLLVISWISFGVAVILLSAASSMSRRQSYGRGWLDGECYMVKAGVFVGSAILVLITVSSTLGSIGLMIRKSQVDQPNRRHAQQNSIHRKNNTI